MKNILKTVLLMILPVFAVQAGEYAIYGYIPSRYIKANSGKKYGSGYVHVKDGIIVEVESSTLTAAKKKFGSKLITSKTGNKYDFIYPGLIDLHNHTKQNNLDVWTHAKGQFENRFEWRAWNTYKLSVSGNMNSWIGYGKPIECAAFRWSELQAMVLGTTYLQGPSSCVKGFGVLQVEDNDSYISKKEKIQAPTDLVIPADMTFVWQELRPLMAGCQSKTPGDCYGKALAEKINEHCDIPGVTGTSVFENSILSKLKDQALLKSKCKKGKLHNKFIRYVYWIHGTIAGKLSYIKENKGALIAHLAEGGRHDHYNNKEWKVAEMLGFVGPHINFVHGVGIEKSDLKTLGKNGMGLIWSLYSNLLLYGETLDIKAAKDAGVIMSLGSDWLPTGTRGILEEVKLAAAYVDKDPDGQGLKQAFDDEELFLMLTENPAKMINHWDIGPGEAGIGRLAKGAAATLITTTKHLDNPYSNLVRKAYAEDINLVMVNGSVIYGSEKNLKQAGFSTSDYEKFPTYFGGVNDFPNKGFKTLPDDGSTKASKMAHLIYMGKTVAEMNLRSTDECNWKEMKGFVHQDSFSSNASAGLADYQNKTGLNLDRYEDMHKLLAMGMLTQSRNLNEPGKGKKDFAVTRFPSLISCNTPEYMERTFKFILADSNTDEFSDNRDSGARSELRKKQKLGRVPTQLAKEYAD